MSNSNAERFLENERYKTTNKEACFAQIILCVAKSDITDIIIIHPLAKKSRQIM